MSTSSAAWAKSSSLDSSTCYQVAKADIVMLQSYKTVGGWSYTMSVEQISLEIVADTGEFDLLLLFALQYPQTIS